jgi:ferric-dicitrate binding protein FerR (iron transport regulator)
MSKRSTEEPTELGARVLAARGRSVVEMPEAAPTRSPLRWTAVLIAVLAVIVFMIALGRSAPNASAGRVEPSERTTQPLARRGVAVLEAGAAIAWAIDSAGALIVQHRGEVFYRVQRGAPFRVETPVARIDVSGASFRVRLHGARATVRVEEGNLSVTDLDGTTRRSVAGDELSLVVGRFSPPRD